MEDQTGSPDRRFPQITAARYRVTSEGDMGFRFQLHLMYLISVVNNDVLKQGRIQ